MTKIIVGIDPGKKTGIAIWDCEKQKFKRIDTMGIVKAMKVLSTLINSVSVNEIWFEDSRLRRGYFGKDANLKQQGAGSIKRDCSIWQEFCEYHDIKFKAIAPAKGQTKWGAEYFKRLTGWSTRTSEHARDAAALVFGAR